MRRLLWAVCCSTWVLLPVLACLSSQVTPAATLAAPEPNVAAFTRDDDLSYGINIKGLNYDDDSLEKGLALGFEWLKIYDHPPPERLPAKVLFRVNLPQPGEDWEEWGHYRRLDAELYADRIDAYEIGNEPNLIEEWGSPPDPAGYARLLEIAYREIKAADPDALIVSAGLAPVNGGDGAHVDDLEYLRTMYANGAGAHFDVLGVHPFGFSYPPGMPVNGEVCATDRFRPVELDRQAGRRVQGQHCQPVNGLCFRRAELAREIMVANGDADKPVWATEFGWIIRPPSCCLSSEEWQSQAWYAVSEGQQARYILDAYAFADEHWPWIEVMVLWNLDYSRYPSVVDEVCPNCDAMGWYSILHPDGSPRLAYRWLLGSP